MTEHVPILPILGMSIMDMLNSLSLLISTAASPRELSSHIYGAKGNQATCTIQSVFMTMGFVPCSMPSYPSVTWESSSTTWATILWPNKNSPHLISILYPLIVCIFAVSVDLFLPRINMGCSWYSNKCAFAQDEENCIPAPTQLYHVLFDTAISILISMALLIIVYSTVSIYLFVCDQTLAIAKYTSFRNESEFVDIYYWMMKQETIYAKSSTKKTPANSADYRIRYRLRRSSSG